MDEDVKTIILSSSHRDYGTEADCYFNVGASNLLDQTKKYLCKVKWIHFAIPNTVIPYDPKRTMWMTINGLTLVDTYYKTNNFPFLAIDCDLWSSACDKAFLYEPSDCLRKVIPSQHIWNVKLFHADTNWVLMDPWTVDTTQNRDWTMELQFIEI